MASNSKSSKKRNLAKKLNEVVRPYCKSDWCILKEILCSKYEDPRFFVQLKCVEHFKFEESERQGIDIGWEKAHMEWVDRGYAKWFAEYYDENLTAEEIYEKILEKIKN